MPPLQDTCNGLGRLADESMLARDIVKTISSAAHACGGIKLLVSY